MLIRRWELYNETDEDMNRWLKGIGIVAVAAIALEIVAYVGLTLLGPTAFRDMRGILNPVSKPSPAFSEVVASGAQRRCATYRGELFCITEGSAGEERAHNAEPQPAPSMSGNTPRRCAEFQGQSICIDGDS
jgi:hypothetical protein